MPGAQAKAAELESSAAKAKAQIFNLYVHQYHLTLNLFT
jgi:hypothetical protein